MELIIFPFIVIFTIFLTQKAILTVFVYKKDNGNNKEQSHILAEFIALFISFVVSIIFLGYLYKQFTLFGAEPTYDIDNFLSSLKTGITYGPVFSSIILCFKKGKLL